MTPCAAFQTKCWQPRRLQKRPRLRARERTEGRNFSRACTGFFPQAQRRGPR
jgi:hypothetical protein